MEPLKLIKNDSRKNFQDDPDPPRVYKLAIEK